MLRRVNKEIVRDCNEANDKLAVAESEVVRMGDYARALEAKLSKRGHRIMVCVPHLDAVESPYAVNPYAEKSRARQVESELTDHAKIRLVDNLLEQGWMKKTQTNNFETVYSIWLVEE